MTDPNVNPDRGVGATSLSLLERLRTQDEKDEKAWARLADLYGPLLERWCLRAGLRPEDAADVRQEVLANVARSIDTFRRDRPGDTFRGWLYTITRNRIRDRLRRPEPAGIGGTDAQRHLAAVPAEDPEQQSSDPDAERMLYLRAIDLVRGEFEPTTWQAFWRVTVDGCSPADVAAELGLSRNAVYLARSRVVRRLRQEFSGLIESVPEPPEESE